jgi:hypothetical protein
MPADVLYPTLLPTAYSVPLSPIPCYIPPATVRMPFFHTSAFFPFPIRPEHLQARTV